MWNLACLKTDGTLMFSAVSYLHFIRQKVSQGEYMRFRCAVIALLCLFAALAYGQEITGDIRGIVRDTSGAVVSGAKVQVINTDRNAVIRDVTTSADGAYVAAYLP